jgi:SAM-dependent methyltransferase
MKSAPDPTQRFGARADAYSRARPGYPPELVATLAQDLALPAHAQVADIGCGTGISSELFLHAGFRVIGIEPNAQMRAHLSGLSSRYAGFRAVDGRAEATGLPDASVDLAIAAQAFHWFDVPATRREALRILRRPARSALIWNDRRTEGSAFSRGYEDILLEFGTDYREVAHRHNLDERIHAFFGHALWRKRLYAHATPLDFETLAARLNSASYVPGPENARHEPMMAKLRALFDSTQVAGQVSMEFETRVLFGEMGVEE